MWGKEVRYPTKNVQTILLILVCKILGIFSGRGAKIAGKLASLGRAWGKISWYNLVNFAPVLLEGGGGGRAGLQS